MLLVGGFDLVIDCADLRIGVGNAFVGRGALPIAEQFRGQVHVQVQIERGERRGFRLLALIGGEALPTNLFERGLGKGRLAHQFPHQPHGIRQVSLQRTHIRADSGHSAIDPDLRLQPVHLILNLLPVLFRRSAHQQGAGHRRRGRFAEERLFISKPQGHQRRHGAAAGLLRKHL